MPYVVEHQARIIIAICSRFRFSHRVFRLGRDLFAVA